MPAPYDYTLQQVANPAQPFLQGIQMGDILRKREEDRAAAIEAKRAAAQRQAFMSQLMAKASAGTIKPADYEQLTMLDPANYKAWSESIGRMNTAQKEAGFANISGVYSALAMGTPEGVEVARRDLQTQLQAAENSDPQKAQTIKATLAQLDDPVSRSQLLIQSGVTLNGLDPERFKKLTENVAAQRAAPFEQRKLEAQTVKAEREVTQPEAQEQYEILNKQQISALGLPTGTYQRSTKTGKITAIGSGGVTVNMPPQVQVGTIPQGYKLTYDAQGRPLSMEPIPGSQAARELKAEQEKSAKSTASTATASNIVIVEADRLRDLIKGEKLLAPVTGVTGAIVREKGGVLSSGSAAVTAQKTLDTIKANIGFDRITQMRNESPTGGALGNITEKELMFLQSVLGSLDLNQDKKVLLQNIDRVKEIYQKILEKASAYPNAEKYGFGGAATSKSKAPAADASPESRYTNMSNEELMQLLRK